MYDCGRHIAYWNNDTVRLWQTHCWVGQVWCVAVSSLLLSSTSYSVWLCQSHWWVRQVTVCGCIRLIAEFDKLQCVALSHLLLSSTSYSMWLFQAFCLVRQVTVCSSFRPFAELDKLPCMTVRQIVGEEILQIIHIEMFDDFTLGYYFCLPTSIQHSSHQIIWLTTFTVTTF